MGRRKQLPDHSGGIPLRYGFFSDQKIEEIRDRYEFGSDFPLGQHLEECAEDYFGVKGSLSKRPAREQKELLQELVNSTNALLVCLNKIGLQTEVDLLNYPCPLSGKPHLLRHDLIDEIRGWNQASKRALSGLKKRTGKGGRPSDTTLGLLVKELHKLYRDGTGKNARITKYSDGREQPFGGKFFKFVDFFLKEIGHEKQNLALGKAIEQSLKSIPKTSPK